MKLAVGKIACILGISLVVTALTSCSRYTSSTVVPRGTSLSADHSAKTSLTNSPERVAWLASHTAAVSNDQIDSVIDPTIRGAERDLVRKALLTLRLTDRQNVLFQTPDGVFHSNWKHVLPLADIYLVSSTQPRIAVDSTGRRRVSMPSNIEYAQRSQQMQHSASSFVCSNRQNGTLGTETGLFHRVTANCGYTEVSGQLDLTAACQQTSSGFPVGTNDSPYAIFGGWPDTGIGGFDFGFQFSVANQHWDVVFASGGSIVTLTGSGTTYPSVACTSWNSDVSVTMYSPSTNNVALFLNGYQDTGGSINNVTFIEPVTGWKPIDANDQLKRMFGIGQSNVNASSGEMFAVNLINAPLSYGPNFEFANLGIGSGTGSNNVPWLQNLNGTDVSSPPDSSRVLVNEQYSPYGMGEYDGIFAHQ